jgi:hypothetical protein
MLYYVLVTKLKVLHALTNVVFMTILRAGIWTIPITDRKTEAG